MLVYFDSQDQVPAHLQEQAAAAENGMFSLEVASAEDLHDISGLKSALEREREARRRAEREAKQKGRDQVKARAENTEQTGAEQAAEQDRIKALVESRFNKERIEYEARLKALETSNERLSHELDAKKRKLGQVLIDASVTKAFDGLGIKVRPGALDDVLARARQKWSLDQDGKPTPADGSNGEAPDFSAWAASLYKSAAHLFDSNAGGGAPIRGGEVGPGGRKRISRHDKKAFSQNLDGIARGEISLVD